MRKLSNLNCMKWSGHFENDSSWRYRNLKRYHDVGLMKVGISNFEIASSRWKYQLGISLRLMHRVVNVKRELRISSETGEVAMNDNEAHALIAMVSHQQYADLYTGRGNPKFRRKPALSTAKSSFQRRPGHRKCTRYRGINFASKCGGGMAADAAEVKSITRL